jgi:heterodisulfide reductase subunit B
MKYAYYPGCAAHSTARDMHFSTLAVARALGIELVEPVGWTCCGATAAHQTNRDLAVSLATANLLMVQNMGLDMVANCAACYNRMKIANHEVSTHAAIRRRVNHCVGGDYDGSVKVLHLVEVLLEAVGLDTIKGTLKHSLNGLKVACYYGCLLLRPPALTPFDDPENPTCLERLVTVMGGESLEWPHRLECCGGGLSLARTDVVVRLTEAILSMAKAAGADCVAVSCPMCQLNLDVRQQDIENHIGRRYDIPIVYITQLLGLSLGIAPDELGLHKLMVSPAQVINAMREAR